MKIQLKKGLDIKLSGSLIDSDVVEVMPDLYAVIPDDFPGLAAKLDVREGDEVKVGSPVIHDKNNPQICLVSPVSGKVKAVVRGERRKVLRVEILSDGRYEPVALDPSMPLLEKLCRSGLFACMRRRPFDTVPRPDVRPCDIFVTAFDSAPLAPNLETALGADAASVLSAAVNVLGTLTDGKIYISTAENSALAPIAGAEMVSVSGPHPAGNPGIQIANIAPVNKGEEVWTLDIITLYNIGKLVTKGEIDTKVLVAVVGPEVKAPKLLLTRRGAAVAPLIAGRIAPTDRRLRVISGNVLTGTKVDPAEGFLHFPWRQITVIADGSDVDEFMGWASLSPRKLSVSRAFPLSRLRKAFSPDARINGGRRAMIMSGEYDRVMPADIMVEYLLKAILSHNIDDMEALGIYEIAPEDVALCEFVDTSKLPVQQIVRDGLDYLKKETE